MVSHFSVKPDHLSESNINGPGDMIPRLKTTSAFSRLAYLFSRGGRDGSFESRHSGFRWI